MAKEWTVLTSEAPDEALLDLVGGYEAPARLLMQRGFTTAGLARPFLDPSSYEPAPASALFGLSNATTVLVEQIRNGRRILVWGDFDVDGQTSTALLVTGLRDLAGPGLVRYHVPNRATEGHGIREEVLQRLLSDPYYAPECLITCDTGITDHEAVVIAKQQGLTVIITDHHDPDVQLLEVVQYGEQLWGQEICHHDGLGVRCADAIVDPKFQPVGDPLASLPGVGVAYTLMQEVYARFGRAKDARKLLDLVALGIVADVAEQKQDTRYLLQLGLRQLRVSQRIGLVKLMELTRVNQESINTGSIGFQIGPRMNALGRLDDATSAVELLTTDDPIRASQIAAGMERLNQERRLLTSQITSSALTMLERHPEYLDSNVIVLGHEGWHPGIVGIVASKIVEEFQKPTILLVLQADGTARGSARSSANVDIGASIAECSELLMRHGGHPGAAGVTLQRENINAFRGMLNKAAANHMLPSATSGLSIDLELTFDQVSLATVDALETLSPFGRGNPEPCFLTRGLRVVSERRFGAVDAHRALKVTANGSREVEVVWFNSGDAPLPEGTIDLLYNMEVNDYRGRQVQLRYVDCRRSVMEEERQLKQRIGKLQVYDLRQQFVQAETLPQPPHAVWYAEGILLPAENAIPAYSPRHQIKSSSPDALVIWSVPPSASLLQWMFETVQPETIYLCGQMTSDETLAGLVRQVAGMCKYDIERSALLHLDHMAARLGVTERAIRISLLWLQAKGLITLGAWKDERAQTVRRGSGHAKADQAQELEAQLEEALAEVRAYRRFHQRATLSALGLPALDASGR